MGTKRLQNEYMAIARRSPEDQVIDNYFACPDPKDIFVWYYLVWNLKECPYEGGYYLGKLKFPPEYPLKPPSIEMITPNGRFRPNKRICMSMTNFHPKNWSPAWKVSTIILGLISFMLTNEETHGCVMTTESMKK